MMLMVGLFASAGPPAVTGTRLDWVLRPMPSVAVAMMLYVPGGSVRENELPVPSTVLSLVHLIVGGPLSGSAVVATKLYNVSHAPNCCAASTAIVISGGVPPSVLITAS